ncbi:hypothetical protein, partial [Rhizobium sp.]|uniref:hypothetical protein n=1 Tax=Rhizobium sp. TaxID=391 RepID=UPI0028A9193D
MALLDMLGYAPSSTRPIGCAMHNCSAPLPLSMRWIRDSYYYNIIILFLCIILFHLCFIVDIYKYI